MHKTKRALIDTVLKLMNGDPSVPVTMASVLDATKITSGSLYYHFDDFQDLIDHALIDRYTAYTKAGTAGLAEIFDKASSPTEVRSALAPLIESRHDGDQGNTRAALAWIAAQATLRPQLKVKLGPAQREMTETIADVVRSGQAKGFVRPNIDPWVCAVFIQSYALGRIVDDLAGNQMDSTAWTQFIKAMVADSILTGP